MKVESGFFINGNFKSSEFDSGRENGYIIDSMGVEYLFIVVVIFRIFFVY